MKGSNKILFGIILPLMALVLSPYSGMAQTRYCAAQAWNEVQGIYLARFISYDDTPNKTCRDLCLNSFTQYMRSKHGKNGKKGRNWDYNFKEYATVYTWSKKAHQHTIKGWEDSFNLKYSEMNDYKCPAEQ